MTSHACVGARGLGGCGNRLLPGRMAEMRVAAGAAVGAAGTELAALPAWVAAALLGLAVLLAGLVLLADRPAERAALLIAVRHGHTTAPRLTTRRRRGPPRPKPRSHPLAG
jgi:hypothetical protein